MNRTQMPCATAASSKAARTISHVASSLPQIARYAPARKPADVDRAIVGGVLTTPRPRDEPVLAGAQEVGCRETHQWNAANCRNRSPRHRFAVLLSELGDSRRSHRLLEVEMKVNLREGT